MPTPRRSCCPACSEPWGLVVNEAAARGLPLLVSQRAGCAATLVPEPEGTTGARFDPLDVEEMTAQAGLDGRHARRGTRGPWAAARPRSSSSWGPDRFAEGTLEALGPGARGSSRIRGSAIEPHRCRRSESEVKPMSREHRNTRRPWQRLERSDDRASRDRGRARRTGWLHLCNGLDPVRDGGMVPSILGMTGALGRLREAT